MTTSPLLQAVAQRAQRWIHEAPSMPLNSTAVESSIAVRQAVIEAMARHDCDHYARRPGIAPLCRAVAQRLAAKDLVVDPDDGVVITGGVAETRFVAVRALAAEQSLYILAESLGRYRVAAEFAGATLHVVNPNVELPTANGGVFLTTSHSIQSQAVLARLAQWVETSNLTVIADEIGFDLLSESSSIRPFASLPGMAERTLTLGDFSSLQGSDVWQVAWFAGSKKVSAKVRNLKQAMTICSPAPGQFAALASLKGERV